MCNGGSSAQNTAWDDSLWNQSIEASALAVTVLRQAWNITGFHLTETDTCVVSVMYSRPFLKGEEMHFDAASNDHLISMQF